MFMNIHMEEKKHYVNFFSKNYDIINDKIKKNASWHRVKKKIN